jgi:hypothetical protein
MARPRETLVSTHATCKWCPNTFKRKGLFDQFCSPRCKAEANAEHDERSAERDASYEERKAAQRAHQAWIDSLSDEELSVLNDEREKKVLRTYAFVFGVFMTACVYSAPSIFGLGVPADSGFGGFVTYVTAFLSGFSSWEYWIASLVAGVVCMYTPGLNEYGGRFARFLGYSLSGILLACAIVFPLSWFMPWFEENRSASIVIVAGFFSLIFAFSEITGVTHEKVGEPSKPRPSKAPAPKATESNTPNSSYKTRALRSWVGGAISLAIVSLSSNFDSGVGSAIFMLALLSTIVTLGMAIGYTLGVLFAAIGHGEKQADAP